jgi:hypothetical protein
MIKYTFVNYYPSIVKLASITDGLFTQSYQEEQHQGNGMQAIQAS